MAGSNKRNVIIFQKVLPHYRIGVFETICRSSEFNYTFCFGDHAGDNCFLNVIKGDVPFAARFYPLREFGLFGEKNSLYFQGAEIKAALNSEFDVLILSADPHIVSSLLGSVMAKIRGKKVIHWGHGLSNRNRGGRAGWWVRRLLTALSDAVILYGGREAEVYAVRGIDMRKIFIAHNALDTREASRLRGSIKKEELEEFRRIRGLSGKHVLILAGRIKPEKRVDLLIEAMPEVMKKISDIKLVLIGDGPERAAVSSMVNAMDLNEVVQMTGPVFDESELARYYLCSDLAVCPGQVGLFVNHAFAYGVPILTSDNLWIHSPEIAMVERGRTGMFFEDGSAQSLASRIVEMLEDQSGLAEMGRRCARLIAERYNEEKMAKAFDDAVRYVLEN